MMTIQITIIFGDESGQLAGLLKRARVALRRWRVEGKSGGELHAFNDYMLADIGLARDDPLGEIGPRPGVAHMEVREPFRGAR